MAMTGDDGEWERKAFIYFTESARKKEKCSFMIDTMPELNEAQYRCCCNTIFFFFLATTISTLRNVYTACFFLPPLASYYHSISNV